MFGYITPVKCELRLREYEYYRAAYCGMCNALHERCGMMARFVLNYDFVFAALLLSEGVGASESLEKRRCMMCLSGKKCIISEAYGQVADASVVLMYLKLCDDVKDKGFFRSLFSARLPRLLLSKAYRRAKRNFPEFCCKAEELYIELCELENNKSDSIDATSDKFGNILALLALGKDEESKRVLSEIFYHIGRFIYILDALDDFSEDMKRGEYNPIAARYKLSEREIPKEVFDEVLIGLRLSVNAASVASRLLGNSEKSEIIRNITELGMMSAVSRVMKKKEKTNEKSV